MSIINNISELHNSDNYINKTSKDTQTQGTNFADTVSSAEKIKKVTDRIEKEIPGVYLNVVDYKKIQGFQSYSYPTDKIYQKNLTLEDFNKFPKIKNTAMDSPEYLNSLRKNYMKKAVLIHPDTLEKMSRDPEYYNKIMSQVKGLTDQVGTCPMPYPDCMITSMTVSVDESGNVQRQWGTGEKISISESKRGSGNSRTQEKRDKDKERLEQYLEKLWYERKLTQKAIRNLQISRKEDIARIQKANLLKNNPYDLD